MPRRTGEQHPKVLIPDWKVEEMRQLREGLELDYAFLAWLYDTSEWTVRDIVTYRTRSAA